MLYDAPLLSSLPELLEIPSLKFILTITFGALFIGLLVRVVVGSQSSANGAVSAAMGVLFIYTASILVSYYHLEELMKFLAPLPFISFHGNMLSISGLRGANIAFLCSQFLSLLILSFLVNLIDSITPKRKRIGSWLFFRCVCVAASMLAHYLVTSAFNSFLPGKLAEYAPVILLGIIVGMFLLGILKVLLSIILTVVSPVIGGFYTFFFSNKIGKQISKSFLTSIILCIVISVLVEYGYSAVNINSGFLSSAYPLLGVLLGLWYIIGNLL